MQEYVDNIVAYLFKAGTARSAETAVARERLCKRPLLGNRFITRNNGVTGKFRFNYHPCSKILITNRRFHF
jgi:hypothetical protein